MTTNGRRIADLAVCVAVSFASTLGAAERIWDAEASVVEHGVPGVAVRPSRYLVIELDRVRLQASLDLAPMEGVAEPEHQPVIELPLPDGSFGRFRIEESRVMAPGLAVRFPEIRTFRGIGVDDPTSVATFDLTLKGFHGMILSAGVTVYINPIAGRGGDRYVSFERNTAAASAANRFDCAMENSPLDVHAAGPIKSTGPVLRTYRTAIAATGEYTQYHGGTKAKALSAMVVVMNRINGIFRRELSVQFELIDDNDRVVFTNPETDPYTHDDTAVLILENQTTLDNRIGVGNYDHGHLFNTHNGGRAGDFGTACKDSSKGQGVSGLRVPAGEVFMVDLVAHEMGHQLGSPHTYNSIERTCSIARNEWVAYEPGSGSTIMSYAGVCGVENIQAHSDDYFHGASLDTIGAYLTGAGGSCGSVTQTGNQPPTVEAGPGFTIPAGTPFILGGTGFDGSPLTFTWEQFDLGPPSPPMTDDGLRPLFRSHPPIADGRRVLPPMSDLLDGSSSIGEALPTTTRRLTFRLTARDGLGGVGHDVTVLQVDGAAGPFVITAPSAGDLWTPGETAVIAWDVAGSDADPIACDEVDILLSNDGGATFDRVLAEATPNDGMEEITAPSRAIVRARVIVACSENIFFAVSPQYSINWWRTRHSPTRTSPQP